MQDRRRSFLISLHFCQTTLYSGIESASGIHVWHKEVIINWCANIYSRRNTGRPVENCDQFTRIPSNIPKAGHITNYSKAESTVRLAMLHYSTTQFVNVSLCCIPLRQLLMYCSVLFLRSFLCKAATKQYVSIQKWEFDRSSPRSGRTLSVDRPLFSALLVLCHGPSLLGLLSHLLTWLSDSVPCNAFQSATSHTNQLLWIS